MTQVRTMIVDTKGFTVGSKMPIEGMLEPLAFAKYQNTEAAPCDLDPKVLQRLRQSCRVTLERYTDLASQSSDCLSRLTPASFDPLGRTNLTLLQQKENKAHEAYLKARAALSEYILGRGMQ
jgi:hypothetical protein